MMTPIPGTGRPNSVDTPNGVRSGFLNDVADQPARVREEDSETAWMTRRAMDFMAQDDDDRPWLLHLFIHQATLALYRSRALSRHVWFR